MVWFGTRAIGWDKYGQPWSFFLSIGAAAVLLHLYRDTGLDEMLARRESEVADATRARPSPQRAPLKIESRWERFALAAESAAVGAFMLGVTGFLIGFFGPLRFHPGATVGPMLGIFFTGPGGVLLGALVGGALRILRPEWPTRWRLWTLNVANVGYGLFVLDLVADPWWHWSA
ncbi:MAG TPA: hypothetical protein VEL51_23430 [Vicinamibacterales bacterium]|nr:hypothetical protein [Vicinamibacterales bacterium]